MKEIGEFFRDNFAGAKNTPSSHTWKNISKDVTLRKYNKIQKLKKGTWYGVTAVLVMMLAIVLLYMMFKNPGKTLVLQNESIIETKQKERVVIIHKEMSSTICTSAEPPSPSPSPSPLTIHSSVELISHTEEIKPVEKEQPIKVSIPLAKNAIVNPFTSNTSFSNIPIEKREIPKEENDDSDTFINTTQPTQHLLHIPNAFTPNNDGLNDVFIVYASAKIADYEINIYDRSGQLMYNSKQIDMGWDGTYRREPAPQGVYVYFITFTDIEKRKMAKQGSLLLIR